MPKAENSVLPKAEDLMSGLERASIIGNADVSASIKNRGDNIVKGLGTSLAASPALLLEATKQSLGDWNKKVKTEGMEKALRGEEIEDAPEDIPSAYTAADISGFGADSYDLALTALAFRFNQATPRLDEAKEAQRVRNEQTHS